MRARVRSAERILHLVAILALATGSALPSPGLSAEPAPPPPDLRQARALLDPAFAVEPAPQADDDFAPQAWQGGSGHLLALILLHTYRNTLSRSDMDLCAFRPSCSRFTQLAIDEFGAIRGILLGADRLLRDGPSALDYGYRPAGDGRHLLDPIADYQDVPCTNCSQP